MISSTPKGDWDFCVTNTQVGCIEEFKFEDSNGSLTAYSSSADLTDDYIELTVGCFASGATCEPPPPFTTQSCGSAGTYIYINIGFSSLDENSQPLDSSIFINRQYSIKIRTGSFNPVFSMGGQINSTSRTTAGDLFTFELQGQIQKTYGVNTSSVDVSPPDTYRQRLNDFLQTSIADSVSIGSDVSVMPLGFLYSTSLALNGECVLVPLVDAFIDSNGGGWRTSMEPASAASNVMSKILFEVFAPHFLPESNGADDKFVPARLRMWLPTAYLQAAGFSDTSTFTTNDIQVSTRSNPRQSITLDKRTDGVMVDYGLIHYSAPDPVTVIYKKISPKESVPIVSTPAPPTKPQLKMKVGKKLRVKKITSYLGVTIPKGAKVTATVNKSSTRVCALRGSEIRGIKSGKCRLSVAITPNKGKKITHRTVVHITR